jgi:hypothetical protein
MKTKKYEVHLVMVKQHGGDGVIPIDKSKCIHRGENCCISSSGESFCGGFCDLISGNTEFDYVVCSETEPLTFNKRRY